MDIKTIQKQIEYSKAKIDRLNALFKLPENIIKENFNILDIDLIIQTLTELKTIFKSIEE